MANFQTLVELLLYWMLANALHYLWIHVRLRQWEHGFVRDAQGLRPGVVPYTIGTGPIAVLWVHGFADSPAIFRRMTQRLADTGRFTCRAMRLPGAGEPMRPAARVTLADLAAAVRREIAELRRDHAQVWLVGHSMGASLALQVALEPADGVVGVMALAPMIRVSRRRAPVLPPALWFRLANVVFCLSRTFESCFAPTAVAADDPAFTINRDRFIPFNTYCTVFALTEALAPRAPALRVPIFAALAIEDRVVDTRTAQHWLKAVTAPKTVRLLPEVSHDLPLEIGWQALTDEMAGFIEVQNRQKQSLVIGAGGASMGAIAPSAMPNDAPQAPMSFSKMPAAKRPNNEYPIAAHRRHFPANDWTPANSVCESNMKWHNSASLLWVLRSTL